MIKGETFAEIYKGLRSKMLCAPFVSPRGKLTKELLFQSIELTNPRSRIMFHEKRKYNIAFNCAEFIEMVNGSNSVQNLHFFNKNIAAFSDDGSTFHGAYGPRVAKWLPKIVEKLKSDKDSRQAVLNIYEAHDGLCDVTKDVPCTLSLQYLVRNDKLYAFTSMRSNDLFWGLQYDLFNFTMIQELLANEIGIDVGSYYHVAGSLHVYEEFFEMLDVIEEFEPLVMEPYDITLAKAFSIWQYMQLCVHSVFKDFKKPDGDGGDLLIDIFRQYWLKKYKQRYGLNGIYGKFL